MSNDGKQVGQHVVMIDKDAEILLAVLKKNSHEAGQDFCVFLIDRIYDSQASPHA